MKPSLLKDSRSIALDNFKLFHLLVVLSSHTGSKTGWQLECWEHSRNQMSATARADVMDEPISLLTAALSALHHIQMLAISIPKLWGRLSDTGASVLSPASRLFGESQLFLLCIPLHEAHEPVPLKLALHDVLGLYPVWLAVDKFCLHLHC